MPSPSKILATVLLCMAASSFFVPAASAASDEERLFKSTRLEPVPIINVLSSSNPLGAMTTQSLIITKHLSSILLILTLKKAWSGSKRSNEMLCILNFVRVYEVTEPPKLAV